MASLNNIVKVTKQQYDTLVGGGTINKDGVSYSYDENALYLVESGNYVENARNDGSIQITRDGGVSGLFLYKSGNSSHAEIYDASGDVGFTSSTYGNSTTADIYSSFGDVNITAGDGVFDIAPDYIQNCIPSSINVVADRDINFYSENGNYQFDVPPMLVTGERFLTEKDIPKGRTSWACSLDDSTGSIVATNCRYSHNYGYIIEVPQNTNATVHISLANTISTIIITVVVGTNSVVNFYGITSSTGNKTISFLASKANLHNSKATTFVYYDKGTTATSVARFNVRATPRFISNDSIGYMGFEKTFTIYNYRHIVSYDITGTSLICQYDGTVTA